MRTTIRKFRSDYDYPDISSDSSSLSRSRHLTDRVTPSVSFSEGGATLVEFALVAAIFFMLVFSIIEISRYMAIRGLLTKAAQVALSQAQKSSAFHLDVRPCAVGESACLSDLPTYRAKRDEIVAKAEAMATSALVLGPTSTSKPRLKQYRVDESDGFSKVHSAMILRPLEEGMALPDNVPINHPTTSSTNDSDSWIALQAEHPYEVRMSALVSPLLPWPVVPDEFDISVVVRGYPEVPRTTKIPPALGLPLPPVPQTTTTTTQTTAGTSPTTTSPTGPTTTVTTGGTTTTEATTTTTTICDTNYGYWMCGGVCRPPCNEPNKTIKSMISCGCDCEWEYQLCDNGECGKCPTGLYLNPQTCGCMSGGGP